MKPDRVQVLLDKVAMLHATRRFDEAERVCAELRVGAPRSFEAFYVSGLTALQLHRIDPAVELLTQARELSPESAECGIWFGSALLQAGRAAEAEKPLRDALRRKSESVDGWSKLAQALLHQGRLDETLECHRKIVTLRPNEPSSWIGFGLTLNVMGRASDALQCHNRALALDPNSAPAHLGRAQALHQAQRMVEAVEGYDRVLALAPGHLRARSLRLLALNCLDRLTTEELFSEHVAFGRAVGAFPKPSFPNTPDPTRKLRLGILSPDLREHSCTFFLEPLLQHVDRSEFELFLYHDHYTEDDVSVRLRKIATMWRNFVGQPDARVEETIRADAPDILIDLAGHMTLSRLPLFARRLAPLQVTYLGYPNTTGLPAMDYRFTDEIADPSGEADAFATEKLVRFAPCAWAYAPPVEAPIPAPPPSSLGAPITFGSFNNPGKLTDSIFAIWGRLLARVAGARLLLKGNGFEEPSVQARYRERMRRAGIADERVEFLGRTLAKSEHLALYGRVDVALDTFPYHGTTTTCEALWMGVPVVTLAGDRHASRVGASLLTTTGHPEWIARSADEYVAVATELARDRERLAGTRASLREQMRGSALCDHAGQARRFTAALRRCWIEWCAHQHALETDAGCDRPAEVKPPSP